MQNLGLNITIGTLFNENGILGATKALNKLQAQSASVFKSTLSPKTNLTPLNKLKSTLDGVKAKIKNLNTQKLQIQANIDNFKSSLLEKVALGASVAAPIKMAIDFESAMADVKKVVDFDSKEELQGFSAEIRKLSQTIPLLPTELAKITASGGQLGIAKKDLMGFTTLVAKISTAFDMSAEQAGDTMATIMNVYGLGLHQMQALGDSMNHISDNSAAKAKDIAQVLSRIGGTARVMGLSADNAAALASAFLAMGKAPEVAGTAINSLFTKLLAPEKQTQEFKNALQEIGMSAEELKEVIQNNPQKGIQHFLQTLSKVDKANQMGVLTDLFGAQFGDDLALLVSGLENYKKSVALVNDQGKIGSMDREFNSRAATTANTLTLLKSSLINLGITIGSVLLPPLNAAINVFNPIANALATLAERFPLVSKVIVGGAAGFAILVISGSALAFLWNVLHLQTLKLIGGFFALNGKIAATIAWIKAKNIALALANARLLLTTLATKGYAVATLGLTKALGFSALAIKGVGVALSFIGRAMLLNPIGLIITAIALGAVMLIKYWTPIKDFFLKISDAIKNIFSNITTYFKGLFIQWITMFNGVFEKIGSVVGGIKEFFGFGDKKLASSLNLEKIQPIKAEIATAQHKAQNVSVAFTGGIVVQAKDGKIPQNSQLRRDIQREVEIALKKSAESYKNRTFSDVV